MLKNNIVSVLTMLGLSLYFSGCTTMGRGMDYTINSMAGIEYPKKSGKIYIESTTKEDTKNITPNNAQLNGFDNVVIKDIEGQCDVIPELTDVLTEHGWVITKNKEEADYQIYTSVVYCGYAGKWLVKSNREIPMKERFYYKSFVNKMKKSGINGTPEDIANQDEKVLAQIVPSYDVTNLKYYFNVYDYRYEGAPDNVKKLLRTIQKKNVDANGWQTENNSAYHGIIAGSNTISAGNTNGGLALMGAGLLIGLGGDKHPIFSASKIEVKILDTDGNLIKKDSFSMQNKMNKGYDRYDTCPDNRFASTKIHVDRFAIGKFYK